MNADRKPTTEEKKRKKQARQEIDALFKFIKAGCKRLKEFEETMKRVDKVKETMERYKDVLDPAIVKDITAILAKIDRTTAQADQFCKLADRLKDLTASLYNPAIPRWVQDLTPAGWAGVVSGVVVVLIAAGGLITAFSPFFQATITIGNQGCDPIQVPQGIPNIPGVSLWTEPIGDGGQGKARIPPYLQVGIDSTRAGTIAISIFNIPLVELDSAGLKSLLINGREIKNQVDVEKIASRANYSLVLVCR